MMATIRDIKVSVVIPTKNGGPLFDRVLEAVLSQETDWPYEVIVVDSGSADNTVETVRRYPSVRLIEISPSEFGHGKTRNFAISQAAGTYIAMITQDAMPANVGWLSALVDAIDRDDRIAGVFGRHIAYPEASPFTCHELEQHFAGFAKVPVAELEDHARYTDDEGYRQFLYFFSDNNALLRRAVWECIAYPEVDFAEDQAWARLIIEAGYRKAYAHEAAVLHSHEYGFIERLQRSFDESFALGRLFGYNRLGLRHALRSCVAITLRDISHAKKKRLWRNHLSCVLRMPLDNFMRIAGAYLGGHGERLPRALRMRLSRDRRLMMVGRPGS